MEKILLTRSGYEKIVKELELLSRVERPQVVQEILETAPEGRPEKNLDFQATLARKQRVERRIKQLQHILANAEVLVGSNLPPDQVRFNCRVLVKNLGTGKEQVFKLVGVLEADAGRGQLSIASPLGLALLGRRSGDTVSLETPRGPRSYQILDIQMDEV